MKNLTIKNTETWDDIAEVVSVAGQGCNYETKKGVEGFQVDFLVAVTNNDSAVREFTVSFQCQDRSDNIMAYNGYEMALSAQYGNGADESEKLEFWLAETDEFDFFEKIKSELNTAADNSCKQWLADNE